MEVGTDIARAKYHKINPTLQQQLETIMSLKNSPAHHPPIQSTPDIININLTTTQYPSSKHKKIVYFTPLIDKTNNMSKHHAKGTRNAQRRTSKRGLVSYKSLNCSFLRVQQPDPSSSHRSIKALNPQLSLCKHYLQQILKKFSLFRDSLFSEKQMVSWISPYCRKKRAILFKLFFIHKQHAQLSLQTDSEILQTNLEGKLRDSFTNCHRFVTAQEMQNFDRFLQQLYIEKNTIKMREMEQSIRDSMRKVCTHVRNYHNNEYSIALRKKPVQISRLLQDIHEFEEKTGALKRVSALHRNRFGTVNETDLLIDLQAAQLNKEVEHCRKKCDFQMLAQPIVRIALR